jgi:polygalacturonase
MLDGHGGVTVGSEMSGGVRNVRVHHCYMRGNDRGLRIKTRRGRGKYAVVDNILFDHVRMEGVKTPLVVNALYYCDPDGKTDWVQSREKQPVDDTTPTVGSIRFEHVHATDCEACVGYILGLPERPVREILLKNCRFSFNPNGKPMVPALANGVKSCQRRGLIARFADSIFLDRVRMEGVVGDALDCQDCGRVENR